MTILRATFEIPKNKFKNANAPMGHVIAAQKSAWIKKYASEVWEKALKEQHNLVAIEPSEDQLPVFEISDAAKELTNSIKAVEEELQEIQKQQDEHNTKLPEHKLNKAELRKLRNPKTDADIARKLVLEDLVAEYDHTTATLKADVARTKKKFSTIKSANSKTLAKEMRKVEGNKQKAYIKKKIEINEFQHLFKTAHALIICRNVTMHNNDAGNFQTSIKPIVDAGTETGILWEDDNNKILLTTTLTGGKMISKEYYVIELILCDKIEDVITEYEKHTKNEKSRK